MDAATQEALEALWQKALDDWDDEMAHRSFLEAAAIHNVLPFAAGHYRDQLRSEEHRARAEAQLQRITAQALTMLEASRSPPPNNRRVLTWVAFVVSLSLVAASIFAMTR